MRICLRLIAIALSLLFFLPTLFWWQIPVSLTGILICHLILITLLLKFRSGVSRIQIIILVSLITCFYLIGLCQKPEKGNCNKSISFADSEKHADIKFIQESLGFLVDSSSVSVTAEMIYSLNQELGKVALGQFKFVDGKVLNLAYLENDRLYTRQGWAKNRILMRRLSAILRQKQEPVVVILNSAIPAGSTLVNEFMYQARLEDKTSFSKWSSLFGKKNKLLLGRGVRFCSEAEEDSGKFSVFF